MYLAHHWEEYTYPVQDASSRTLIRELKERLEPKGIYLLGRFAEWEYYNMDAAIGAALDLDKKAGSGADATGISQILDIVVYLNGGL